MAKIKNDRKLTLERLKQVLSYDPSTGLFTWRVTLSPKAVAGTVAGAIRKFGYRVITIDKEQHRASRLAWFYVHGKFPECLIDHQNRNRSDDRLDNLRPAGFAENLWNIGPTARNTSDFKGVCRTPWGWQADIACQNNKIYLGSFRSAEEASAAYGDAAKKLHGEFASTY